MKLPDKKALILLAFSPLVCCCCCIPFGFPGVKNDYVVPVLPNVQGVNTSKTANEKIVSSPVKPIVPVCEKGKEISRSCSACNKAIVSYNNLDCTTYTKQVDDATCSSLCPTPPPPQPPPPAPVYVAPKPAPAPRPSSGYACNCKKTCTQMSSCAEAQYQLNVCKCSARDADHDGVACDADCQ